MVDLRESLDRRAMAGSVLRHLGSEEGLVQVPARELITEVLSPHPQDDAHVDGRYHLAWERATGEAALAWGKAERLARMLQHALSGLSDHGFGFMDETDTPADYSGGEAVSFAVCKCGDALDECKYGKALAAIEAECE